MWLELLIITTALIITLLFKNKRKDKNLPPGPYNWPILGNVVEMVALNANYPHLALQTLAKKHGDIMSLQFGSHFMVVFSSFEVIKEFMSKPEATFSRFAFPFVPDRAYGKTDMGIIFNSGESWQELKRYTIRTLRDFGFGKRNSMDVIMQEEVSELLSTMKKRIEDAGKGGEWEVDPWLFASSAINVLWSLVAGYRFHLDDKHLHEAVKLNDDICEACGLSNRYTAFPWVKTLFPKASKHAEHLKCYEEMQQFMVRIIGETRQRRSLRSNQEPESYMEAFMDEIEKQKDVKNTKFTEQQFIVVLQDLFLAGSETTSTSLNWTLLYLSLNPRVQEKVYEEICRVVGTDKEPTLDHEKHMPYTKATLFEMFRTANIVPTPPPRMLTDTVNFKGYTIPKGAGIMYNMEPVLRDKEYWGDPENFRPERFISVKEDGSTQIVNTERVTSFGFGRRLCLGESLAWNTLFLYVINIIQTYELSIIPGQVPTSEPKNSATLSPQRYSLKFELRK